MKRTLTALALLATPLTASAGVGFTAHQEARYSGRSLYYSAMNLPTLDIVNDGLVVQLNVLDLLEALNYEELDLGVSVYKTTAHGPVNGDWKGVLQPGASLEFTGGPSFSFDPVNLAVIGQARLGFQKAQDFGFGIYVVPGLGVGYVASELEMMVSGGIQISAWMK